MLDLIEGFEPSPDPPPARSRAPTKATDKARAMRQPPAVQARAIRPSGGYSPGPTARDSDSAEHPDLGYDYDSFCDIHGYY